MVGRGEAGVRVSEFVEHSALDGGALLVVGDPGIGKWLLLQVASELATELGGAWSPPRRVGQSRRRGRRSVPPLMWSCPGPADSYPLMLAYWIGVR
jgi:hypothetical protein